MSKEYPCVHYDEGICNKFSDCKVRSWCVQSPCKDQEPSNADRIRAMTDEELAELLTIGKGGFDCFVCRENMHDCSIDCKGACLAWLKQPYTGGADHERT